MTPPNTDRVEELCAGFILGNLDTEELDELQQLLDTHPELANEFVPLLEVRQRLAAIPLQDRFQTRTQGAEPPPRLRRQICQAAATATGRSPAFRLLRAMRRCRTALSWRSLVVPGAAIACIVALAGNNWLLRQQLHAAQNQLLPTPGALVREDPESSADRPPEFPARELMVTAKVTLPTRNLAGIEQVIDDHLRSIQRGDGPAEYSSSQLQAVLAHFQSEIDLTNASETLELIDAQLLGGSLCQFKGAAGLRLSYVLDGQQLVSVYQLKLSEPSHFPTSSGTPIYAISPAGGNMVLWLDRSFLYAVVADDVPLPKLKKLSETI